MSSRAPIAGTDELRDKFKKADTDASFGYLTVKLDLKSNEFKVAEYVTKGQNDDNDAIFTQMAKACVEKEHCYFIIRDPSKNQNLAKGVDDNKENESNLKSTQKINLYILIHFAPDLSPVKERMMYASSRPSLKAFLGQSSFSEDYHCSSIDELSLKKIVDARTLHHKIDFRSDAEIEKEQAALESVATSAKSSVMKSLPIDIKESAVECIGKYKEGAAKCCFLSLTKGTQGIEGSEQNAIGISEIKQLLNESDPKYILFTYSKSKMENVEEEKDQKGEKLIFGYFCPDKADRKYRFTYSTCKANVIDYCTSIGLEFYAKVEVTALNDFNNEYMDYHIFPIHDKKETFAMPKGPKQRRKSKSKRKKINLDDL